jgi:L-threonylcarbamoyladenylate synthase
MGPCLRIIGLSPLASITVDSMPFSEAPPSIINSLKAGEHSSYLGFKNIMPDNKFKGEALNLSKKGNLEEAAANLFTMIRYFDKNKSENIMVAPIPKNGIGIAINDRLERAAK